MRLIIIPFFSFSTTMCLVVIASAQWNQQGVDLVGVLEDGAAGWAVDLN